MNIGVKNWVLLVMMPLFVGSGITACTGAGQPAVNTSSNPTARPTASPTEEESSWQWLFDGTNLDQWTGLGRSDIPAAHWQIVDQGLHKVAGSEQNYGGDLRTKETYKDFELCFEFMLTRGANSGVKYNVSEAMSAQHGHPSAAIGFEFQILDDRYHPDAKQGRGGNRTVGALYDLSLIHI